nr:hypothetical protein GCM10025730_43660 [Promicromonospora thailandica]
MSRRFRQVNVFSPQPVGGNPVAVVHDADGLSDGDMAAFARWTNLSETTFLLPPTPAGRDGGADYRVRIWTPGGELPFAGHPTLGTAHAWLEAGGVPAGADVVQECGVGLVRLRRGERLAFAAPPLARSGPVDDADLARIARALRIAASDVVRAAWVDNGPGWVAAQLRDADAVLALEPDLAAMGDLKLGVVGAYPGADDDGPAVEVRAFVPSIGVGRTRSPAASTPAWGSGSQVTCCRRRTWRPRAPRWDGAAACTWRSSPTAPCGWAATR